jgi:hypothetical protein
VKTFKVEFIPKCFNNNKQQQWGPGENSERKIYKIQMQFEHKMDRFLRKGEHQVS